MEGNCDNPSPPPPPPLLNEDSLIQILLWLPVISLLRFKSVCKSWRAIIENPFFIHSHATFPPTTTTTNMVGSLIFFRGQDVFTVVSGDEFEVYLGTPCPDFEPFENLGHGSIRTSIRTTMVGCCNGIICLHGMKTIIDHFPKSYLWSIISLWNPAIKQYRFIQVPFALQGNHEDPVYHFVGFGFDVKTKEYKVLLIIHGTKNKDARGVHVYGLSTNSWRCIDATSFSDAQPYLIYHESYWNQGHYLNGTYLFISGYLYDGEFEFEEATSSSSSSTQKCFKHVIMSFDFTKEIFRSIQLPFDLTSVNDIIADLILFGEEKIAVTKSYHVSSDFGCTGFDIWVLNEYGRNESWSKFYTFVADALPKFITDNGEFILLDGGNGIKKLKLLNIFTGEIKEFQRDYKGPSQVVYVSRAGVYKPSLIPIVGNGATDHCLQV